MLEIKDLTVKLAGKEILNRLSLKVEAGDILVLMGPNGAGKSTLARAVMGLVKYQGKMNLTGSPEQRAQTGVFLSFQEPPAIAGVTISDFLRAITPKDLSLTDFYQSLQNNLVKVGLPEDYADRELNVGFSGGEKKKLEMLQLLMLNPQLAVFDEIDSGLDVDTIRVVAKVIKSWHTADKIAIIITHNSRLIKRLNPNKVAILKNGKIAKTGNLDLALTTLAEGFDAKP